MLLKDMFMKVIGLDVIIKDKYGDIFFDTRVQDFDDYALFLIAKYGNKKVTGIDSELLDEQTAFLVVYVD